MVYIHVFCKEVSRPSLGQIRINRVRHKPNDSIQPFKFEDILPIQNIPKVNKGNNIILPCGNRTVEQNYLRYSPSLEKRSHN